MGDFQLVRIFFFRALLVQEFFFSGETPCTNFFFRQILLFLTVKSWFIIYLFVIYKLFYTHNRSKDTGHLLMQNLFENVHTVREEEATWSGRLPCTSNEDMILALAEHFSWTWKIQVTQRDSNPWPLRCRCSALALHRHRRGQGFESRCVGACAGAGAGAGAVLSLNDGARTANTQMWRN